MRRSFSTRLIPRSQSRSDTRVGSGRLCSLRTAASSPRPVVISPRVCGMRQPAAQSARSFAVIDEPSRSCLARMALSCTPQWSMGRPGSGTGGQLTLSPPYRRSESLPAAHGSRETANGSRVFQSRERRHHVRGLCAPVLLESAEATTLLQLLTGYRMDETEALVPVPPGEAHARLGEYRRVWAKLHPELAAPDPFESVFKEATPVSPPPTDAITPEEAAKRIGETCSVRCMIKSVGRSRNKSNAFLNTHSDYRDAGNLVVVIPNPTPSRLQMFGMPENLDDLLGRTIIARGKIMLFSGRLEVMLADDTHIWIVDP